MAEQPLKELRVDAEACMGHGRCYTTAPGLFDADDRGHAVIRQVAIPAAELERARLAEHSCPEHAISIVEAAGA